MTYEVEREELQRRTKSEGLWEGSPVAVEVRPLRFDKRFEWYLGTIPERRMALEDEEYHQQDQQEEEAWS